MGYFSELSIDVIELFEQGKDENQIAKELKISVPDVIYILNNYADELEESEYEYDDSMDGDAATALASAGFGTDEDYGSYDMEY